MSNIRITWKDPVVREDDGGELLPADIARIDIGLKVGGASSFTPVTSVPAGTETFTQTDLPPGDYEFELIVVDRQVPAKSSTAIVVLASIPLPLNAPGPVTDAVATVF